MAFQTPDSLDGPVKIKPSDSPFKLYPYNAKCKTCRKTLGEHRTDEKTGLAMCPAGEKTRIGYLRFSPTEHFVPGKLPKTTPFTLKL